MKSSVTIDPLGKREYRVSLETPDRVGLLSVITGFFASYGVSIVRGNIRTHEGKAVDSFDVIPKTEVDWEEFKGNLLDFLERVHSGQAKEVHAEIRARLIHFLRKNKNTLTQPLHPVDLHINQELSPSETVVDIRADDTPAFLYALTNALSLLGINIVDMEVNTVKGKVQDRLGLTYEGQKILSENKLKAVQWAILLVKQFTHLLPRVPDPSAAIQQFASLSLDIFERKDFGTILATLQRANTLEDLSKVLGTSQFLWEEFIRTQYESLIPIFGDEALLKQKKTRAMMTQELKALLAKQKSMDQMVDALNEYKDREMFRIDLRHILGRVSYLGEFAEEFTDLVEAVVDVGYSLAWQQTLMRYPQPMMDGRAKSECAVFGLGKFGGQELGYASDLELLFVYSDARDSTSQRSHENQEFYAELVRAFKKLIRAKSEGVFEVDLRLRPYGKDGPLAASLEAFKKYYSEAGGAWDFERQALVKLRFITGSPKVGDEIEKLRDQYVYGKKPFDFKEALRLRVRQQTEHVATGTLNAKYSPGGLLDVEYLVQTLQIAYGRHFTGDVRHPNTIKAMRALWQVGVLSEKQFQDLRASYIFLRNLINSLRIARGHAKDLTILREDSEDFTILGRRLGFLGDDYKVRAQFKLVLRHYMEIASNFYETWMDSLSNQDWEKIGVTAVMVQDTLRVSLDDLLRGEVSPKNKRILEALGFSDIPELVSGLKRLCPSTPAFEYFAKAIDSAWPYWKAIGDPNLAVKHLEWYVESIADKDQFWKLLAESEKWFSILLTIFGASKYLSEMMIQSPEEFYWVQDVENFLLEHTRKTIHELQSQPLTAQVLRKIRHRETLRIAMVEMMTRESLRAVYETYSGLADFVIEKVSRQAFGEGDYCVLGLGKLGGKELNFSSDVDLMFMVAETALAQDPVRSIQNFINVIKKGGPAEFLYRVDLRLRPHGENGSLFMTPEGYRHYYDQEAEPWEFQALVRARPVAGNLGLGRAFLENVSGRIWRSHWEESALEQLRAVKRRYDEEVVRDGETETNIKMGFGGIRDVEFAMQMIQLIHAHNVPTLRSNNTFETIEAIRKSGFLSEEDCNVLDEGYQFLRRVENHLQLFENRQIFTLPEEKIQLRCLAKTLGFFGSENRSAEDEFREVLRQKMQAARVIFERIYYQKE